MGMAMMGFFCQDFMGSAFDAFSDRGVYKAQPVSYTVLGDIPGVRKRYCKFCHAFCSARVICHKNHHTYSPKRGKEGEHIYS